MIATRSRIAVRALADIARHQREEGAVSLQSIAQRQCIPVSYLEPLLARLRREKLLLAPHRPGGGFRLMKLPEDTTLADIFQALEEETEVPVDSYDGHAEEGRQTAFVVNGLWSDYNAYIKDYISSVSIRDICDNINRCFPEPVQDEENSAEQESEMA